MAGFSTRLTEFKRNKQFLKEKKTVIKIYIFKADRYTNTCVILCDCVFVLTLESK